MFFFNIRVVNVKHTCSFTIAIKILILKGYHARSSLVNFFSVYTNQIPLLFFLSIVQCFILVNPTVTINLLKNVFLRWWAAWLMTFHLFILEIPNHYIIFIISFTPMRLNSVLVYIVKKLWHFIISFWPFTNNLILFLRFFALILKIYQIHCIQLLWFRFWYLGHLIYRDFILRFCLWLFFFYS